MPITYHYESEPGIIRSKATDVITAEDLFHYFTSVIEDTKIEKSFIEIVDFEFIKDLVIAYSELNLLPNIWDKYLKKGCKKVLIYAPTNLSYGTSRMMRTIATMAHDDTEELFQVFRSKDELENKLKEILE